VPKIPQLKDKLPFQNVRAYRDNPIGFVGEKLETQGDIFGVSFGKRNVMITSNPAYAQQVLQTNHRNYQKAVGYRKLKLLLGNGLFTSEGEFWLNQRRLIQPAFHKSHLAHFGEIMIEASEQMLLRWKYYFANASASDQRQFNLLEQMSECTLEIVCESLLGQKLESGGKIVNEELPSTLRFLVRRVLNPLAPPMWLPTPANRKFKKSTKKLRGLITSLLFEKKHFNTEKTGQDLLSLLLHQKTESGEPMPNEQITDEILTFFLAGHETSAVALTWAFYELNRNPNIENKLREEVLEVVGDKLITVSDLPKLTYCKQVCQEVLRLYPPAWALAREAIEDDTLGDFYIQKGDSVVINTYWLHRNPEHWQNPTQFLPERWETENSNQHKFAYAPFGGGPRLCIGNHFAMMEMQIVLASVLQKYQLQFHTEPNGFDCALTLRPKSDLMVSVSPLNKEWTLAGK
jgi:cytochrome P450